MKCFYNLRMAIANAEGSTPSHFKPAQLAESIKESGLPAIWAEFEPSEWEDFLLIHDKDYVESIRTGEPRAVSERGSVTWSPELAESLRWTCGSMVAAAQAALMDGVAVSLSSGFHHARYQDAGPFCLINGLALAALKVLDDTKKESVLILDCDYHYGDGTSDVLVQLLVVGSKNSA